MLKLGRFGIQRFKKQAEPALVWPRGEAGNREAGPSEPQLMRVHAEPLKTWSAAPARTWGPPADAVALTEFRSAARASDDTAARKHQSTRQKAVSVAGSLALLAIAALMLGIAASMFLGFRWVTVYGGSMGDSLPAGSVAITHAVDADSIEVGDAVIAGNGPGRTPFIHRVVEIQVIDGQRVATTKGDANDAVDADMVVLAGEGERVQFSIPYLGYALNWLRQPLGLLLLIGGAMAIWASGHTVGFIRSGALGRWTPGLRGASKGST